jgi:hypothetical protein
MGAALFFAENRWKNRAPIQQSIQMLLLGVVGKVDV